MKRELVSDLGIVAGIGITCAGIWLWLPPLAIVIAGVGLISVSALVGYAGPRAR